ncbi:MAG: hypothetical protein IPJ01_12125 [Micavibrio sp.]|nr:hypothetical protein [Micavibrio sp.]
MALVRLMMPHIRAMAGLSIGFKTDRTDYTDEQLVVPVTDALCRGLPITGNCFNVIGGNFYCTLEGWEFLFGNQDVFTFPDLQIGSVEMGEEAKWVAYPPELHKKVGDRTITGRSVPGESYVEAIISCAHRGTGEVYELRFVDNRHLPGGMDERLKVPMNRGMHMQSVIGKAKCRAMKALWRHAHAKCRIVDPIGGDQDEDDRTIDATPQNVQTQPTTAPPAAKTAPKAAPKPTRPWSTTIRSPARAMHTSRLRWVALTNTGSEC